MIKKNVKNHCSTDNEYITFLQAFHIVDLPIYFKEGDKYIMIDYTNINYVQDRLVIKLTADYYEPRYLIDEWFTEYEADE